MQTVIDDITAGFNTMFGSGMALPTVQSFIPHIEANGFGREIKAQYELAITLADIRDRVEKRQQCEVLIATSNSKRNRDRANQVCQLGSEQKGVILLCSDAISKGIRAE